MNHFLENPSLWPDFHNSLIIAIRDELAGRLAPDYFLELGRRTFLLQPDDEVGENYLEIHEVETGELVTVLEMLSPANKLHNQGREEYERKRDQIFRSRTNLVEIDLLRAGEPMMVVGRTVQSDYRILVSRGVERPHARLFAFNLRQPIPAIHIPLLPGDEEPLLDLGEVLHDHYDRARFDLRLNYEKAAVPPIKESDTGWALERIAGISKQ
jgi:hypothetical protein